MSYQQAPIPSQQGAQRWASRSSPNSHGPNSSSSNGHSEGHSSTTSNSSASQYVDYPASPPQMGLRSAGPSTPFGLDDNTTTRLLAGQSQPSSPVPADFSAPLPPNQQPQMGQYGQPGQGRSMPTRSGSGTASSGFASSPLNPSQPSSAAPSAYSTVSNPFNGRAASNGSSRPASRGSMKNPNINPNNFPMPPSPNHKLGGQVAEDGVITSLGLGHNNSGFPASMGQRGSMVLYRLADSGHGSRATSATGVSSLAGGAGGRGSPDDPLLQPPRFGPGKRTSYASSSGDSIASLADSKYPATLGTSGAMGSVRGLIPYAYDPAMDENEPFDEEDLLHDPNPNAYLNDRYRGTRKGALAAGKSSKLGPGGASPLGAAAGAAVGGKRPIPAWEKKHFPWRGVVNVGVLVLLILGLLCLFVFYPVLTFYRDRAKNAAIQGNIRINGTGQAPVLINLPDPVDEKTPESAKTRTGFDGQEYELVFSDEFETPGRTFYPGDDPFWEAVDLWYGATADIEWYDPSQVTTRDGALIITMDSIATTDAHLTPGSTAPFTLDDNHNQTYRSGMVQTWNKFCFTAGYIEVSVVLPGPDQQTQGYWPGAWTMGNLGRPGYPATTDGMWPYTYDSCDVGTFPNQTFKDLSGPAAALHSDQSREKNDFRLSWLSGQRLSACSCPGGDHPGPNYNSGRGAPEIDIFEAEKDKNFAIGHVVSQSAQFGPFSHDYLYSNDSNGWTNWDPTRTRANTFRGSAVQQSVSGLTRLPSDMFQGQGNGTNYRTIGFEYTADPNDRINNVITWQVDGQKTHTVKATAVGPDPLPDGSGVGQRLIPEEPMSIVLNLGISNNWQVIDLTTMQFPAEFKIDYVRVYQRKGQTNVGCNPKDRPTTDYIASHLDAYTNPNMTVWPYEKPKNSMYDGC